MNLLSDAERAVIEVQTAQSPGRVARRFWELVGPSGAPFVAIANRPPKGWRCTECGYATWGYWERGSEIYAFVSEEDVPTEAELVVIGRQPDVGLAVSERRWEELRRERAVAGVQTSPIGVLPAALAERDPLLPSFEEDVGHA